MFRAKHFLFFNIEWNFLPEKKSKVKIKNFNFDKIEIFFCLLACLLPHTRQKRKIIQILIQCSQTQ